MVGNIKEIIAYLEKNYNEEDVLLVDIWGISDVKSVWETTRDDDDNVIYDNEGEDCSNVELSDSKCIEVLKRLDRYYDANTGINWDEVSNCIEEEYKR